MIPDEDKERVQGTRKNLRRGSALLTIGVAIEPEIEGDSELVER